MHYAHPTSLMLMMGRSLMARAERLGIICVLKCTHSMHPPCAPMHPHICAPTQCLRPIPHAPPSNTDTGGRDHGPNVRRLQHLLLGRTVQAVNKGSVKDRMRCTVNGHTQDGRPRMGASAVQDCWVGGKRAEVSWLALHAVDGHGLKNDQI